MRPAVFLWREQKILDIIRFLRNIIAGTSSSPLIYHLGKWTSNRYILKLIGIFVLPVTVFRYFRRPLVPGRKGLAFILIAKNEAPYIEEWINFHHKQGASHFIIYDNESTDNLHEVLKPYIERGLVTYHVIKGRCRQCDAYNMAINDYGRKFKYMAFLDADEFLFIRNNTIGVGGGYNLYEFIDGLIASHKNAGGIGVNWCIFGSAGHITKPEGGVLENYTMRSENDFRANFHIKTICDPMRVFHYGHCHFPTYRRGFYSIDENGGIVRGPFTSKVSFRLIRINHYFTKSKEEYKAKRQRGMADNLGIRPMSDFDDHDRNEIHDTEILSRA